MSLQPVLAKALTAEHFGPSAADKFGVAGDCRREADLAALAADPETTEAVAAALALPTGGGPFRIPGEEGHVITYTPEEMARGLVAVLFGAAENVTA